jgi:hypothetical protein
LHETMCSSPVFAYIQMKKRGSEMPAGVSEPQIQT